MIQVYGARDSMEAEYVKGLLSTEGITAVVLGEALDAARGDIPYSQSSLPSVWVNEADQPAAQRIVDEFKAGGPAKIRPQASWTCPHCGEMLEGQFTTCWKCGFNRPESGEQDAEMPG
jgi:hypothetical protein